MNKYLFLLLLIVVAFTSTGCIQQALVIPVATINGKIVVPPGKVATGVKISIAGEDVSTYANERGEYSLELRKSGRFLLVARSRHFDVNYVWVDAQKEKEVTADDIVLDEKIVGEALFMASLIDFPDAVEIRLKPEDPEWEKEYYIFYDDGKSGDKLAGDGIFMRRFDNLRTGSQLYSFVIINNDGEEIVARDPHRESIRNGLSEILIPEAKVKLARGYITSDLTGVNYSEVKVSTKKGSRNIYADSDGGYSMAMHGTGREYLVFRSPTFHIRAIPVDLSTVPLYEVPTTTLSSKKSGELKVILIKSDFSKVENPTVVGDFTDWQPMQLYDDGTHGDEVAGDGVYSRVFTNVAPGYHKYAFNITEENQVRDPYEESGDSQYSIIEVK